VQRSNGGPIACFGRQVVRNAGRQGGSPGWDGHNQLDHNHLTMAAQVDKPISGLLTDLKSRGMLDETLIVWGGDFGRTPFTDGGEGGARNSAGRDHNPYGFSVWMAGGGIQGVCPRGHLLKKLSDKPYITLFYPFERARLYEGSSVAAYWLPEETKCKDQPRSGCSLPLA